MKKFREWLNGKKIGEKKCSYQLICEMFAVEFKKRGR